MEGREGRLREFIIFLKLLLVEINVSSDQEFPLFRQRIISLFKEVSKMKYKYAGIEEDNIGLRSNGRKFLQQYLIHIVGDYFSKTSPEKGLKYYITSLCS